MAAVRHHHDHESEAATSHKKAASQEFKIRSFHRQL